MAFTISIDLMAEDNASPQIQNVNESLGTLDQAQVDTSQSSKKLAEETGKTNEAFGQFKNEIAGVIASYGLMQIGQKVGEFFELGQSVRVANETFIALSGGASQASANLAMMQASTGGVVDNMTLMNGANRLLLMGLVQTGDEAARMTQMAVTLGRAMGHDAGQSIEDFAALLANQSIPRLDNFGISSDRVRQRIDELKASGMGMQEAFKLAVLEQGAISLERLGDAANAAITPVDQLKVKVQNLGEEVSQNFATAVNGLVGIAQALAENPDNAAAWQAVGEVVQQGMIAPFKNDSAMDSAIHDAVSRWAGTATDAVTSTAADTGTAAADAVASANAAEIARLNAAQAAMWQDVGADHTNRYWNAFSSFWQEKAIGFSREAETQPGFILPPDSVWAQVARDNAEAAAVAAAEQFQLQQSAMGSFQTVMQGMMDFTGNSTVPEFLDAEGALRYADELELVTQQVSYLQTLNDQGLISDTDLQSAEMLKDQVSDMADQADRAKQAFDNLSLSDIFGQGGGGLLGQVSDDIVRKMQESGASEDQIAAVQQQLDLASGRATESSTIYEEQVVPLLSQLAQTDPTLAVTAAQNIQTFMQQAKLMGLTQEQIAAGLPGAAGVVPGAGIGSFTIKPGQSAGEIAGQNGITIDQLLQLTGASSARNIPVGTFSGMPSFQMQAGFNPMDYAQMFGSEGMAGGGAGMAGAGPTDMTQNLKDMVEPAQQVSGSMTEVQDSTKEIGANLDTVRESLDSLSKGVHKINVELNVTNLDFINSLVVGQGVAAGGGTRTKPVRDQGGTVKGMDARTVD